MRWSRIRQITREEARWRTTTLLRAKAQQLATRLRAPRWNRAEIGRILVRDVGNDVRAAAGAGRWPDVHDVLCVRLQQRAARFVLDPRARAPVRRMIAELNPAAAADARARAERLLRGEYDLLGYRRLRFARDGHRVDWHFDPVWGRHAPRVFYTRVPYLDPAIGDHKIIWELNRHQHWLTLGRAAWLTGEPRYAAAALDELYEWLDANPPLIGINWSSMLEIGFRALSWTWMLHCLLGLETGDPGLGTGNRELDGRESGPAGRQPWLVDMLVALARQLTHIEQNLSYYFSPNTHLTGEALALYVAGTALPELAASPRWCHTGRRVLLEEIDRQILSDGGHAERSTHYQRYTLEFYVLALLTARLAGDGEAASRFAEAAARLAEFTRVMADEHGRLPLVGDDDGGMLWPFTGRACNDVRDALATAAVALNRPVLAPWGLTEETVWVAGPEAVDRVPELAQPAEIPLTSRAFAQAGYVVMRDGAGNHAVFDAGAHGYLNGGHAHADALAVALTLAGRPLLVDPGTATYTVDVSLRDRLRSTKSHNTVTVDGRSQSTPAGPFHWLTRTDARLETWRQNDAFDFAEGVHDGYAPLRHRRAVVRTAQSGWLIADEVSGRGHHAVDAHWHFAPEWTLQAESGRVHAAAADGAGAWLLHDRGQTTVVRADHESGLGWYAPVYGALLPASTVRVTVEADAPMHLVTWVADDAQWPSPLLQRLSVDCQTDPSTVAAAITDGGRRALFFLRMGGAPLHAARVCRVADFESDAGMLHALSDGDRLRALDLADVTRVTTLRQGWISIEAEGPLRDLHVDIEEGYLDLRASMPAVALRVRGLSPWHRLRLNGREFTSTPPADHSLVIRPADWNPIAPFPVASALTA